MRRIRIPFAGREVEFVDREAALRQLVELAEGGTWWPLVVYGPEGCGKTALLRQAFEFFRGLGYSAVYVSPLEEEAERLVVTEDLKGIARRALGEALKAAVHPAAAALAEAAIAIVVRALRKGKERVALLADDVFQAVGVDRAELLVKTMLNLIEYPPARYEKIVVLVASSEGVTRERVGRHRWAEIRAMWNMPRDGFAQLYEQLPGPKPPLDEAWRWTGGNPETLERLYRVGWNVDDAVVARVRDVEAFVDRLTPLQRAVLGDAIGDVDVLVARLREAEKREEKEELGALIDRLVELNLIVYMHERRQYLWLDVPPPERDPELGIGRYYAWQTPLHREAVRKALEKTATE